MNERIRQLAEQATIKTSYQYQTWGDRIATGHKEQFDKEKFAELIVADCLDVVAMRMYLGPVEMCRQECKALASEIKEHFGVEDWLKPFRGEE